MSEETEMFRRAGVVGNQYVWQGSAGRVTTNFGRGPSVLSTTFKLAAWRVALQNHPDKRFAEFILRGIQEGFRVGYAGQVVAVKSVVHNCPSAVEHKEVIDKGNVS